MINRADLSPTKPYRDVSGALTMCAICAASSICISGLIIDQFHIFDESFYTHTKTLIFHHDYYFEFIKHNKLKALAFYALPVISSIASAIWAWLYFGRIINPVIHIRGRQLWRGREARRKAELACKKMLSQSKFGVDLLEGLGISRDQLLKSILVCGAQGGGKTVFINQLLLRLIDLNHKLVIFDPTKGDYSRWVPMSAGLCLISSTDSRSLHWWLGFDLTDEADAAAFAEGLVAESADPLWSNAARLILVGIIVHLQKKYGTNWSWGELSDCLVMEMEDLHELLKTSYPPAATFADPASKTSQSMEKNLKAFTANITRLATTWSKIDKKKRFSFKHWLDNDNTKHRRLVIQMNQRDASLGASISRAIVSYSTNHIASLEFPESGDRSLGWILDEVPQFRKLESLIKLNEIGRSKGVYVLVGFQDSSQISQIYGREELQKWSALFGLRIFPQVVGADSQQWVCQQVGDREVQFRNKTVSGQGMGQVNVSSSYSQPTNIPVILPSELELFGKTKNGIEALFLGLGKDALALTIPFPKITDIRPAHVSWPKDQPQVLADTDASPPQLQPLAQRAAPNPSLEILPPQPPDAIEKDNDEIPGPEAASATKITILDMFEDQPTATDEQIDKDDALEEAAGTVAGNAMTEAVAHAIGLPSVAIDLVENIAELGFENDDQIIQIAAITEPKKKQRKQRKYADEL